MEDHDTSRGQEYTGRHGGGAFQALWHQHNHLLAAFVNKH